MELEQMHQLDAVDRHGTISAAAAALHLSQPSLSRSMRRLERDLGQELFDRTKNHVQLNDAGRLALEHARALIRAEQAMRDAFDELARRQRTLRVGTCAPAPVWRLTSLIVEGFPGTILSPITEDERMLERDLFDRAVDLAITVRPMALPNTLSLPFMTEDLYAFIPAGNPLSKRPMVSWLDLDGNAFLVMDTIGFWMGVARAGLPNAQIIEQHDENVFRQLSRTTDLVTFVTNQTTDKRQGACGNRVAVPISDASAHATFYLTALREASARVRQIMAWVREHTDA